MEGNAKHVVEVRPIHVIFFLSHHIRGSEDRATPFLTLKKKNTMEVAYKCTSSTIKSAITLPSASVKSSQPQLPKTKRKTHRPKLGASYMFCNLISCGVTEKDMVLDNNNKHRVSINTTSSPKAKYQVPHQDPSRKSFNEARSWNGKGDYSGQKLIVPMAVYKPVMGPTCSLCIKPFKPEKMHKHMKSCPGIKAASLITIK